MKNYMIEYRKPVVLALASFADHIFRVFTKDTFGCTLSTPTATVYRKHDVLESQYKLVTDNYTFTWETDGDHAQWFIEGAWEDSRTPIAREVGTVVVALEGMVRWLGYEGWTTEMPGLARKLEILQGEIDA